MRRGASYFFKEYGEDRNAVEYYRHFEEIVSEALALTPSLVADRCWSLALSKASANVQTATKDAVGWVQQGLHLLRAGSSTTRAPNPYDLAIMRAGIGLERIVVTALDNLVETLDGGPGITQPNRVYAIDLYVQPASARRGQHPATGRPEWQALPRENYPPRERFRMACGWLVRNMRDGVGHGRIREEQVTELDALAVFLALGFFATGRSLGSKEAAQTYGPLHAHLTREYDASTAPPLTAQGLVDERAMPQVCQRLVNRWTTIPGNRGSRVRHILMASLSGRAIEALSPLVRCAVLAGPMEEYGAFGDPTTSMIVELCWRRLTQLDPALVAGVIPP